MRFNSAPDRHRWLSNNSMMVAAKLATSPKPNWTSVRIGDVAEKISTGTTPPSQERRYYDGDIDWYTPSDIGGIRWLVNPKKTITSDAVIEKKARMFDAGSILITCIGQIGRVGILAKESSSNQQITGVKFVSEIDPEFAYFSLFAKQAELEAAAPTASTLSILNQNRLSEIYFSYPTIKEQKQIAKFLAWCEDRLLNNKPFTNDFPQLPDYLNDFPRIVAHIESLARRVNEAQRLREEAIILSKVLQSRALDGLLAVKNFLYQPLKDILGEPLQNGLSIPASGIGQEGILFAKVGIVNTGNMNPRETKRVNIELPNDATFWMKENDIFVSRGNSLELVGRAAAYKGIPANCAFPDLLIRIRVDQARIDSQYIVYYFQTLEARKYIESQASGTSPSMKKVSQPKLENMPIPVPPLDEQRRIVAYLDDLQAKVNALRELQVKSGEELSALMPSILDRAFKGEL